MLYSRLSVDDIVVDKKKNQLIVFINQKQLLDRFDRSIKIITSE